MSLFSRGLVYLLYGRLELDFISEPEATVNPFRRNAYYLLAGRLMRQTISDMNKKLVNILFSF